MDNRKVSHRQRMFMILQTIYSSKWGGSIGFTGGTSLYFFYNLSRFSVDLDFELIDSDPKIIKSSLYPLLKKKIEQKGGTINHNGTLEKSFRFIVQYGGEKKLKVEFNNNNYPNAYENKLLFGTSVKTMDIRRMFAHKLCAFISRYKQKGYIANRDLFDINFLLQLGVQPNDSIIKIRSKKLTGKELNTKQRYRYMINFITHYQEEIQKNILNGLGELIDSKQKPSIKNSLLQNLLEQLSLASMD